VWDQESAAFVGLALIMVAVMVKMSEYFQVIKDRTP
jgi:hypothetical protein